MVQITGHVLSIPRIIHRRKNITASREIFDLKSILFLVTPITESQNEKVAKLSLADFLMRVDGDDVPHRMAHDLATNAIALPATDCPDI